MFKKAFIHLFIMFSLVLTFFSTYSRELRFTKFNYNKNWKKNSDYKENNKNN